MSASQKPIDLSQINTTGIRIIVLFSLLLDSPKSAEELNHFFLIHPLVRTQVSDDTIRNDINTLRNSGCRISRALKTNSNRYVLLEHPFLLDLKHTYVDSLKKGYNKIYQRLEFDELIQLEALFEKLARYTKNQILKEKLQNISALRFIDKKILKELLHLAYNKQQVELLYKSAAGNKRILNLILNDIAFRNDKLYLFAYDLELKKGSFYLVKNILEILSVKLKSNFVADYQLKVKYKLLDVKKQDYALQENENVIEEAFDGLVIEATSKSEFIMMQNLLRLGRNCVVLEPLWFRKNFVDYIKLIREVYNAN